MIHSDQLRAARALIGMSQADLAERVGISIPTLKRAEGSGGIDAPQRTKEAIADTLRRLGVEFVECDAATGRGVRWATPKGAIVRAPREDYTTDLMDEAV